MSLRRVLADLVDPDRLLEVRELRDIATKAERDRASMQAALLKTRLERTVETAIAEARIRDAEAEARKANAAVARLLEDAARCAHEHHDTH